MTDASAELPTISRAVDDATGDFIWTLRIPTALSTLPTQTAAVKLRVAAWMLRLIAQAIDDLP